MKSHPAFVTVLSLAQLFVVGAGYLCTRVLVRSWDKGPGDWALDPAILTLPRFYPGTLNMALNLYPASAVV